MLTVTLGQCAQIHFVTGVGWFAFPKGSKQGVFLTALRYTSQTALHALAAQKACHLWPRDAREVAIFWPERE